MPRVHGDVLDRPADRDARVEHEHVHRAYRRGRRLPVRVGGDVQLAVGARIAELDDVLVRRVMQIGRDDRIAACDEALGQFEAEAGSGAGDEHAPQAAWFGGTAEAALAGCGGEAGPGRRNRSARAAVNPVYGST